MKRILLTTTFFIALMGMAMAQGNRPRQEMLEDRIEAQRVAFITQRLRLTAEEAQLFWPIYNEYETDLKALKEEQPFRPEIMKMSDEEAEDFLRKTLDLEQRELDLRKRYIGRFRTVLPIQKVAMLGHVERAFNRELLKRVQEARKRN